MLLKKAYERKSTQVAFCLCGYFHVCIHINDFMVVSRSVAVHNLGWFCNHFTQSCLQCVSANDTDVAVERYSFTERIAVLKN